MPGGKLKLFESFVAPRVIILARAGLDAVDLMVF